MGALIRDSVLDRRSRIFAARLDGRAAVAVQLKPRHTDGKQYTLAMSGTQEAIISKSLPVEPAFTTNRGALFSTDCLELLARMRSDSIDCVFADPPFNLGKDYKNGFDDKQSDEQYFAWSESWITECVRVLNTWWCNLHLRSA